MTILRPAAALAAIYILAFTASLPALPLTNANKMKALATVLKKSSSSKTSNRGPKKGCLSDGMYVLENGTTALFYKGASVCQAQKMYKKDSQSKKR